LRSSFFGVTRAKSGSVQAHLPNLVKENLCWQGCYGLSVASSAEALVVTGRAQVARCGGPNSVLANKVAIVHHMAFWQSHLSRQVSVAARAVSDTKLIVVGMAAKTGGHRRPEHAPVLSGVWMAANTVSFDPRHMGFVRKTQMLFGLEGTRSRKGQSMAGRAFTSIVGILVA
tara:strand:+ start:35690 stop:36205 length:516 start_codon:yes stop_codon:yes gene_type:complete